MTNFSENELVELSGLRTQVQGGAAAHWQIYEWLVLKLKEKGVGLDSPVLLWLRGATEVNKDTGAYAALIRTYTETQYQLRYGINIPQDPDLMQKASNEIAEALVKDLLGEETGVEGLEPWQRGKMPTIERIVDADASSVARILFDSDTEDSAHSKMANAAWSGSLLFTLLGHDQSWRLMDFGVKGEIDTLNDVRDVLYAYESYDKGLSKAK